MDTLVTKSRKRTVPQIFWIALFFIAVGVTGYGLASTGNLDNPFNVFVQSQRGSEGRVMTAPNANAGNAGNAENTGTSRNTENAPAQNGSAPNQGSIAWSQFGGVLSNVWFLFAAAAFVIVVQKAAGYVIRQIRRTKRPALATPIS